MGSWFSVNYGNVSSTIIGMQASESGSNILVIDKLGHVAVHSINNYKTTLNLSLTPTAWCVSPRGGWIIGFSNGTISEFDISLNLIQSFSTPGASRAHKSEVTLVIPSKDKSVLFISTGNDSTINLWNHKGIHMFAYNMQFKVTAMCLVGEKLFASDVRQKVSVIDLDTQFVQTVNMHSQINYITPLPGTRGCLAALSNGQVVIISEKDIVAQFNYTNNAPVKYLVPLNINYVTGVITFYCVNDKGENSIRCLEYELKSKAKSKPFFTTASGYLFTAQGGRITRTALATLENESLKNHPQMDLPRSTIVKFLNRK